MFDSFEVLDKLHLNFNPESLIFMNITLGFIMFGVALDIKIISFKNILINPKSLIVGIFSQFVLLPLITFIFISLINPTPAVALGMLLVAACPGGNISNFISSLSKGNVALSVSLTAVSTSLSVFLTPLNFAFWGGLYISSSPLLNVIEIPLPQVFKTIFIILGIPLIIGILFAQKYPEITSKIKKPLKLISILAFLGFIVVAFAANFDHFLNYILIIIPIVFIHNAIALATGYLTAASFKLKPADRRTVSIETGIQNSGLALALIFNPKIFPPELELGGMAFIAAWWGIWHIVSGLGIAYLYSLRKIEPPVSNS